MIGIDQLSLNDHGHYIAYVWVYAHAYSNRSLAGLDQIGEECDPASSVPLSGDCSDEELVRFLTSESRFP